MEETKIKEHVYHHFGSGYHCAEVVAKTIMETYGDKSNSGVIKAASGFGGGIAGTTDELCGAFTGGVIALSYFFGREKPGEELTQSGTMIKEFKRKFNDQHGSLNCGTLINSFSEEEGQMGCVRVTANATQMVSKVIEAFEEKNHTTAETASCHPKDKVPLGNCPFSCGCTSIEEGTEETANEYR